MYTCTVQTVEDGVKWHISSDTDSSSCYTMVKLSQSCTALVCTLCTEEEFQKLCQHMYKCFCFDYSNGHICKHLHRLHSSLCSQSSSSATTHLDCRLHIHSGRLRIYITWVSYLMNNYYVNTMITQQLLGHSDAAITKVACKTRLCELLAIIQSEPESSQLDTLLPHINAQLDNIVVEVKTSTTDTHTFTQEENIPPKQEQHHPATRYSYWEKNRQTCLRYTVR